MQYPQCGSKKEGHGTIPPAAPQRGRVYQQNLKRLIDSTWGKYL